MGLPHFEAKPRDREEGLDPEYAPTLRASPSRRSAMSRCFCSYIGYCLLFAAGVILGVNVYPTCTLEREILVQDFQVLLPGGDLFQDGVEMEPDIVKFDCLPRGPYDEKTCTDRGCTWTPVKSMGVPYCYYPKGYRSYTNQNVTVGAQAIEAYMQRKIKSPYPNDIDLLKFSACAETKQRLHIKITDAKKQRFVPVFPLVPESKCTGTNMDYKISLSPDKTGFKVLRASSGAVIFDAEDIGGLTYADQFLQINAKLPRGSGLYGIGETQGPLSIDTSKYQAFTLWNHDYAPRDGVNLYGSHPFLLVRESDEEGSQWHGLFLLNSNAMDIITQPGPSITFRTIGGMFDFYWFMGSTPEEVTSQYFEVIGKPRMPPYWALGFHLCKFGYGSLERTMQIWNQTRAAGIPFDVQWNDLDYMDHNNDFTVNQANFKGLGAFVDMLHKVNMHYIPLIDPGISAGEKPGTYPPYDEGVKAGLFIMDENNRPFVGKVWNGNSTVWPDFTNPDTRGYWLKCLSRLYDVVKFDGAWIDMNEPSNFYSGTINGCSKSSFNDPPYLPSVDGGSLYYKTVCPTAKHHRGLHYDIHNMYGITEAEITSWAMMVLRGNRRPVVVSRATFPGHGHYASHWTGDVFSTWFDMKRSIAQVTLFNMFGIPFVGADICGFNGNTTVELCARWSQLGAFYPFSRNHNTDDGIDQDPVSLGSEVVTAARNALKIRYTLLPYLYFLFYDAHVNGKTVARPLFFEFPNDRNTHNLDTQFMWGSCLLIVPVLTEGQTQVKGYFPAAQWFDWYTNNTFNIIEPTSLMLNAPLDTIPLFVKGGCIIPTQLPMATSYESRLTPMSLRVYLSKDGTAAGKVYWDDGEDDNAVKHKLFTLMQFTVQDKAMNASLVVNAYKKTPVLSNVLVFGECEKVNKVLVNDQDFQKFSYSQDSCTLEVSINMKLPKDFRLKWETSEQESESYFLPTQEW